MEKTELASVCKAQHNTCVLAASSTSEGETSWLCNSSGSNGIRLMAKLIEGLKPVGADKASLFFLCIYFISISVPLRVCGLDCISPATERMVRGDNTLHRL